AAIGDNSVVGPFAYIRPGSNIGSAVRVGDFVEIKNSEIGDGTKVPHLAYVGDAKIGSNSNIGCGVITANYDGKKKNPTYIGNNVFVGCNTNLVAPVKIEDGAYIAAGSTITEDVPAQALAIARSRQTVKPDWRKGK
ncbi:MAG TPA: DapH/DapD/GlmU-related protein, partial [Bacillota bacterium]|nr:DapH/DapD/GlmU-related protein [Bacillota bacterium]